MRRLGLIGGMSWESTAVYYRRLNEEAKARLGGLHSAELLLASLDFAPVEVWQRDGDWATAGTALTDCALRLQDAGANAIMLCTNTMHCVAPQMESALRVPFLHIADAVAAPIAREGHRRVLLLGTRYTMEQHFLKERIEQHGLTVLVPPREERERVNRVIYDELCQGIVSDASRAGFVDIIQGMARAESADAVLLGCTEIGMLIGPEDVAIPVFDSTELHVRFGMDFALKTASHE